MNYLKKTHPIAQRRQRKKGMYRLTCDNGGLPQEYSLPIGYILRDLLGHAKTLKETKKYLIANSILIGQKRCLSLRHSVSFLETIRINKETYKIRIYKKNKSSIYPVVAGETLSPVLSKTRISPTQYQLNGLGGRNYLINSQLVKQIEIGSTVIKKENQDLIVVQLIEDSRVFVIAGKNMGKEMIYKGFSKNQYILSPILGLEELVRYNERDFFPITGKIISLK